MGLGGALVKNPVALAVGLLLVAIGLLLDRQVLRWQDDLQRGDGCPPRNRE